MSEDPVKHIRAQLAVAEDFGEDEAGSIPTSEARVLIDALDERDALRKRVAELEYDLREAEETVGRLRSMLDPRDDEGPGEVTPLPSPSEDSRPAEAGEPQAGPPRRNEP